MSNMTMNIHGVTRVTMFPATENKTADGSSYEVRTLTVQTADGTAFALTLFSETVPADSPAAAMITVSV